MRRALALLLLLASASAGAEQVLRKGNAIEPETLDPHKSEGVNSSNVLRDLYEGLTAEAADGSIIPGAAESWTLSADGREYVFTLRADGRWSNGDAVTADDFVFGLRRSADPKTGSNYSEILAPIENAEAVVAGKLPPESLGVVALDARTLRIRLRGPTPYFLGLLTHACLYPIHQPSLKQYGERFARAGTLVGNGAYKLDEWVVNSHITLSKNPYYWDAGKVAIDRVIYYPTENQASELKRFRAGELDLTDDIPSSEVRWLRANLKDQMQIAPYLGAYYYGFNLTQPPFRNNPKLRKAIVLAIDRDTLAKKIMGAGEIPAYGWVPPGTADYTAVQPAWASWSQAQRVAEAKKLYAEAGYSEAHPLEIEIRYNTQEDHKKMAIAIAFMLKQALGVQARLVNEEWKVFLQSRSFKHDTQLFRAAWISDYDDPYSFFELLLSSNGMNDMGYDNPAYDALVKQAAVEPDLAKRTALLQDAERMVLNDLPVLPIYFYVSKHMVKPYVKGWAPNMMDHHETRWYRLDPH